MISKFSDLTPTQAERTVAALNARDQLHRGAIVDLLNNTHGVDRVSERLNTKPKSVYEMARRFELDTGVRFSWPWRKDKRPGPELSDFAAALPPTAPCANDASTPA